MTSAIIDYRTDVIEAIKNSVTGLNTVDWYDAIFDENDVKDWSLMTPAAFVAVRDTTGIIHSTGEINMSLDMGVVVVTGDVSNRDSDATSWALIEQILVLVNYNRFGNVNAAVPTNLRMSRLREPELRQMGVALGLVEWTAGLTIGINQTEKQEFVYDPITGLRITQVPTRLITAGLSINTAAGSTSEEASIDPNGPDSDPAAIVFDPVSSLDPFKPIP